MSSAGTLPVRVSLREKGVDLNNLTEFLDTNFSVSLREKGVDLNNMDLVKIMLPFGLPS